MIATRKIMVEVLDKPCRKRHDLIAMFEAIAADEGWNPSEQLHAFADRSVYFALRQGRRLLGGIQLEVDDGSAFWSFHQVWPEIRPVNDSAAGHIAVLALSPEARGRQQVFWLPCIELWRYCNQVGINDLWLEAKPCTLAVYHRIGFPLEIVGDLREHWGEDCYLCRMGVSEVGEALASKATASPSYRTLVEWALRLER